MVLNKANILIITLLLTAGFVFVVQPVFAAEQRLPNPFCTEDQEKKGECTLPFILGRVIKAILGIIGSIALVIFIWGGFQILTAGGSPDQVKKGKETLLWATIGLLVIFLSYALVKWILEALGVK